MGGLCSWQGAAIYNHSTQGKCPILLGAPYLWALSIFLCVGGQRCYHSVPNSSFTQGMPHIHTYINHPTFKLTLVFFTNSYSGFCLIQHSLRFARTVPSTLHCEAVCVCACRNSKLFNKLFNPLR